MSPAMMRVRNFNGRSASQQASGKPAVDPERSAGDVRGAVGGEEADDVADLARSPEAAERDRLQILLARPVGIDLLDPVGIDPAGRDGIDGDRLRPELTGRRLQ